jgi:PAS domain S-box-containing protein
LSTYLQNFVGPSFWRSQYRISMPLVAVLSGSYDYRLVALSALIAILASYAALDLGGRVTATHGRVQLAWLMGGSFAMGMGIWSMHYIGMLAYSLPVTVHYHWPTVLLSLVAAIFASAVALFVVSRSTMGRTSIGIGGLLMGTGIACMHYVGMDAMRLPAMCHYTIWIVVVSVALAILISLVALWLTFHLRDQTKSMGWRKLASAILMGTAIPVMHYTGMAAVSFSATNESLDLSHSVEINSLGIVGIGGVTFMVLFLAILTSFVDRRFSAQSLELQHERDLLRVLLDNIPDYIYFKDADNKFIRINKALASWFGITDPEMARGRSPADYFDSETAEQLRIDDQRILRSGRPIIAKTVLLPHSGVSYWMAMTKVPVKGGSLHGPLIVGISRDITEWTETMAELERSEASFRLLFAAIPHAVFVCDLDTLEILEVNDAARLTYGYSVEEFHTMRLTDIDPVCDEGRLKETLEARDPANLPHRARKYVTKSGRSLDVEITVHPLEFHSRRTIFIMAQDVSEQRRLELDLRHAQRLESVGQLAAGIAHEINTPIHYVGDNLRFLCDAFRDRQAVFLQYERLLLAAVDGEIPPGLTEEVKAAREEADLEYLAGEIPRAMEQSLDGVERVATIVRAMKAFAHPGSNEKMPADLNKALSDALIVANNELRYVADVATDFAELPPVWCNLGDLNQVFLNLLVNAAHAISDVVRMSGGRGEIRVTTRCKNNEVIISVSDTGSGIPPAIQARVFDPFFTTKVVGKGTGQGLAIARNIVVERHGGRIAFEPNLTQGTTFLVSLPIGGAPGARTTSAQPVSDMALL